MKRYITLIIIVLSAVVTAVAQKVSVDVVAQPASVVFRSLMEQTGMNFVYSSELLDGMKVTVKAKNKPLKKVLSEMFAGTDIEFKINGDNVILKRRGQPEKPEADEPVSITAQPPRWLDEVTVESRIETPEIVSSQIGAKKVVPGQVENAPVIFSEPDMIRTLHAQPGVSEGTEGIAGMYVHGGNSDENLYMLDNVPLYQTNHLAGIFSSFNPEIIRNVDFYKSSVPAEFDGRLSSVMDVHLIDGCTDGHHGSVRLGSTAAAFNISGPVGKSTTYVLGLRRTLTDILYAPIIALANSRNEYDGKVRFHFYFMDLNAKLTHRFSERVTGFASLYLGDDYTNIGSKDTGFDTDEAGTFNDGGYRLHWGNIVARAGLNYRMNPGLSAEFSVAYTRYFSSAEHRDIYLTKEDGGSFTIDNRFKFNNGVGDLIIRGDFDWVSGDNSHIRYGGTIVRHLFQPLRIGRFVSYDGEKFGRLDTFGSRGANEFNAYIDDDWRVTDRFRAYAGLHGSLFYIGGKLKYGLSPRLSLSYRPGTNTALKAAYSRTTQYVHQLAQTYLSLPTDQWIPVSGDFKPSTADKVALGVYWQSPQATYAVQAEGYFKWMHNLLDYRDEYYLEPPLGMSDERLTQGSGTAKGVDLKVEKLAGKFSGYVSYSLVWADRTFPDKNGGHTFPARCDNRHTIHVVLNWHWTKKTQLNASWTGHSGNRFTLLPQNWEAPSFDGSASSDYSVPLRDGINNYRLPFYHRLDVSMVIKTRRLDITLTAYNAYCHMNTVAIWQGYESTLTDLWHWEWKPTRKVFYKVKLLPIIPSLSFTWKF